MLPVRCHQEALLYQCKCSCVSSSTWGTWGRPEDWYWVVRAPWGHQNAEWHDPPWGNEDQRTIRWVKGYLSWRMAASGVKDLWNLWAEAREDRRTCGKECSQRDHAGASLKSWESWVKEEECSRKRKQIREGQHRKDEIEVSGGRSEADKKAGNAEKERRESGIERSKGEGEWPRILEAGGDQSRTQAMAVLGLLTSGYSNLKANLDTLSEGNRTQVRKNLTNIFLIFIII